VREQKVSIKELPTIVYFMKRRRFVHLLFAWYMRQKSLNIFHLGVADVMSTGWAIIFQFCLFLTRKWLKSNWQLRQCAWFTTVREQCFTSKGIFHVTWLIFYHIWNTMLICIKLCTHIGQIDGEVTDTTDAAVESVHSGEFPLHHNSFCASEIVT
jgi:hypothetical protein